MAYERDCSSKFPHRSRNTIDKKLYDEYCFSIKKCSRWTDEDVDADGNKVPFPSECTPATYKKLPLIKRGNICKSIKADLSSEKVTQTLAGYKETFKDISDNYAQKYADWMVTKTDNAEQDRDEYEGDWQRLKLQMIDKRNKINSTVKHYRTRVIGVSQM